LKNDGGILPLENAADSKRGGWTSSPMPPEVGDVRDMI
jgi:hypothetical protein